MSWHTPVVGGDCCRALPASPGGTPSTDPPLRFLAGKPWTSHALLVESRKRQRAKKNCRRGRQSRTLVGAFFFSFSLTASTAVSVADRRHQPQISYAVAQHVPGCACVSGRGLAGRFRETTRPPPPPPGVQFTQGPFQLGTNWDDSATSSIQQCARRSTRCAGRCRRIGIGGGGAGRGGKGAPFVGTPCGRWPGPGGRGTA